MCLVDPASGRLSLTEVDFEVRGVLPLVLERSYRSTNIWQSDLGQGWGHSFGVLLWRTESGEGFTFRATDGRRIPLPAPPDGGTAVNAMERVSIVHVRHKDSPFPALSSLVEGVFAVSTEGRPTFLFDARPLALAPLRGLADRSGNLALIDSGKHGLPDRIRDPHGRVLEFARDRRGMITRITLRPPSSEAPVVLVEYRQDEHGNLIGVRDAAGVRRYLYDGAHRLLSHVDRLGGDCLSEYDESGRCVLTQGAGGVKRRTYVYDEAALRTTVTDSLGSTSVVEYDNRERVVRTIDQEGGESTFTYDGDGRLVQATDQLGRTSSVLFDKVGAPAGKVRADGTVVSIAADDTGEVAKFMNSVGATTAFERDAVGRVIAMTAPGGGRTEIGYDAAGNIDWVKTAFGKEVRLAWSPDRRRVVESDADGVLTDQALDETGRVISVRNAVGATTAYEYDPSGEIARIIRPDGTVRTFTRDAQGRLLAWTGEDGSTTRYRYDIAGRCVEIVLPDGGVVRSDYDLESRLTAVVDSGGRRHAFRHTPRGLVAEVQYPDGRVCGFRHDAVGRIVAMIYPDGSTTRASRDERGRIQQVVYPDDTVKTARHDDESHWVKVEQGGSELAREVTPEGQPVEESQDGFRIVREYGEAGELRSVTDGEGRRVGYEYDADGRVSQAVVVTGTWIEGDWNAEGTPRAHKFEYDRVGNLRRWIAPSGTTETRTHDIRGRLVEQVVVSSERTVLRRAYSYDAAGRVIAIDDSHRGQLRFAFDSMGRLTASAIGENVRRFGWGRSGERIGDVHYGAPLRAREGNGHRYDYDALGQAILRAGPGGSEALEWTPRGLLASAALADGRSVRFEYDPHDRLIARTADADARRYTWDNESLWGIQTEDGPRLGFVYVPGMRAPIEQSIDSRTYSIHVDHIGTVRELVDDNGEVAWLNAAGVWGERREKSEPAAVECPLGLPGQIRDEITGLFYNRHRFYDAEIGRYLTPDPVGIFGGLDSYRYPPDPVNGYDPMGLVCRGRNDDPTLYRGDSRPPSDICANGFPPSNPTANIALVTHVNGVPTTGSNWVSTTYEGSTAERFAHSAANQYGGQPLVYVIDNPNCGVEVDCDPGVQAWEAQYGPAGSEEEIAFNGGLPANRVVGYYTAGDPTSFQACP